MCISPQNFGLRLFTFPNRFYILTCSQVRHIQVYRLFPTCQTHVSSCLLRLALILRVSRATSLTLTFHIISKKIQTLCFQQSSIPPIRQSILHRYISILYVQPDRNECSSLVDQSSHSLLANKINYHIVMLWLCVSTSVSLSTRYVA